MATSSDDIAAALDAALDELDDEDDHDVPSQKQKQQPDSRPVQGPALPPDPSQMIQDLQRMIEQGPGDLPPLDGIDADALLSSLMNELQSQIAIDQEKEQEEEASSSIGSSKTSDNKKSDQANSVDETIAALAEEMNKVTTEDFGDDDDDNGIHMLQSLFQNMNMPAGGGIPSAGDDFDPEQLVQGMMKELLAKELMYEPMKQVSNKFPSWLERNKSNLTLEEYDSRCQQRDLFVQLVLAYERQPVPDTTEIMELMQQVQEYGQPPNEIIQDIAPGLKLDSNGVPQECCIM